MTVTPKRKRFPKVFPLKNYRLESTVSMRVSAELQLQLNLPNVEAEKYILAFPAPPQLPSQAIERSMLSVKGCKCKGQTMPDESILKRPVLSCVISVSDAGARSNRSLRHALTATGRYDGTLYRRKLVPLRPGGKSDTAPVSPLSRQEMKALTASCAQIKYKGAHFQKWLDRNELRLGEGETDIQFAWRVYRTISRYYSYKFVPEQDRRINSLCRADYSDCGGLSFLFVGAMRANGLPARVLVGRHAVSVGCPDDESDTAGQCHVKAEFFAKGIGFVPVDLAEMVYWKLDPLASFGNDNGRFVTFHVDPDIVLDSIYFGKASLFVFQSPAQWIVGHGSWDGYTTAVTWTVNVLEDSREKTQTG